MKDDDNNEDYFTMGMMTITMNMILQWEWWQWRWRWFYNRDDDANDEGDSQWRTMKIIDSGDDDYDDRDDWQGDNDDEDNWQ